MNIYSSIDRIIKSGKQQDRVLFYYKDVIFPISYKIGTSNKLVIFFPGAFDREKDIPKFQRESYFENLEYSCISVFDPTLFLKDYLPIGWFQGTKNIFYAEILKEFLSEFIQKIFKSKNEDILLFGTSAGGIPAIKVAEAFTDCKIYAGNIQTNIFCYTESHYKLLLWSTIGENDINKYKKLYADRYHIYDPKIKAQLFYAQNLADDFHYQKHYIPFFESLSSNPDLNIESVLYNHSISGHNPISKDIEIKVINEIFNHNSISEVFDPYK